jgi:hypothetical protein
MNKGIKSAKKSLFVLTVILVSTCFDNYAQALQTQVYSTGYTDTTGGTQTGPPTASNWGPITLSLQKFDPVLGTLNAVTIYLKGTVNGYFTLKNNNAVTINANDVTVASSQSSIRTIVTSGGIDRYIYPTGTNYGATGTGDVPNILAGQTWTSPVDTSTTLSNTQRPSVATYGTFYTGTNKFDLSVESLGLTSYTGPANVAYTSYSNTGFWVGVQYDYTAVPEPSTYMLLGISLGCVGFVRYRMTRGQSQQTA